MKGKPKSGSPQEWKQAISFYEAGFSIRDVSVLMGRSYGAIRNWLLHFEIPIKPQHITYGYKPRIPDIEIERVRFLYERLMLSQVEIAEAMGIGLSAVGIRLKHAGVERRPSSVDRKLRNQRLKEGKRIRVRVRDHSDRAGSSVGRATLS